MRDGIPLHSLLNVHYHLSLRSPRRYYGHCYVGHLISSALHADLRRWHLSKVPRQSWSRITHPKVEKTHHVTGSVDKSQNKTRTFNDPIGTGIITVTNNGLPRIERFKYPGSVFSANDKFYYETVSCISAAWMYLSFTTGIDRRPKSKTYRANVACFVFGFGLWISRWQLILTDSGLTMNLDYGRRLVWPLVKLAVVCQQKINASLSRSILTFVPLPFISMAKMISTPNSLWFFAF